MSSTNVQVLAHTVIAMALIVSYAVLTSLNHDANVLLGILAGQGVGAAVSGIGSGVPSSLVLATPKPAAAPPPPST